MEIRPLKLECLSNRPQGIIGYCLEGIGQARQELDWPSTIGSPHDEFMNLHLAQVLVYGFRPFENVVETLAHGPAAVWDYLGDQPNRHRYYQSLIEFGKCTLFYHSQGIPKLRRQTGRWADIKHWNRQLTWVGQDCYFLAARQLPGDDALGQTWLRLAKNFTAYSLLLHEAGIEIGFTEDLSPNILRS